MSQFLHRAAGWRTFRGNAEGPDRRQAEAALEAAVGIVQDQVATVADGSQHRIDGLLRPVEPLSQGRGIGPVGLGMGRIEQLWSAMATAMTRPFSGSSQMCGSRPSS
ncbi:MAG: hypothetical protein R3D03_04660 [Geminicoccaceae bacterium]